MAGWQFETQLNPDHTVSVPPEILAQLRPHETVRVFLTAADSQDEADWQRLAADQFLNGYGPGDDIYDQLSAG